MTVEEKWNKESGKMKSIVVWFCGSILSHGFILTHGSILSWCAGFAGTPVTIKGTNLLLYGPFQVKIETKDCPITVL